MKMRGGFDRRRHFLNQINIDQEVIKASCEEWRINEFAFFRSVLRGDSRSVSVNGWVKAADGERTAKWASRMLKAM
jgi:hypothetical protein